MVAPVGLQQVVDVAFVLIVSTICLLSLFRDTAQAEVSRKRWKEELKGLEGSLRELIGEACSASAGLDRNLLKRQQELQSLLRQIQTAHENIEEASQALSNQEEKALASKPKRNRKKKVIVEAVEIDVPAAREAIDVPNDTWLTNKSDGRGKPGVRAEANADANTADTLRISRRELSNQIEVVRPGDTLTEKQILRTMDPVTYQVTRRLLSSGKEIHVVARKLEIPIADVRQVDRLLRREMGHETTAEEFEQEFRSDQRREDLENFEEAPRQTGLIQRRQALL